MKKRLLWVAMMTLLVFVFSGVTKAQTANPYAYGVSGVQTTTATDTTLTVSFTLNAPATAVSVDLYDGETLAKSLPLADTCFTAGKHSVSLALTGVPREKKLSWKINVTGAAVTDAVAVGSQYKFWAPYGCVVDNNPLSANFGRILVTESKASTSATYFSWNGTDGKGVGQGIYAFDPQLNPIANASGTYGFAGGIAFNSGTIGSTTTTAYDPRRLAITADGRIFVTRCTPTVSPLYEVNANDLNADFTPVITGALNDQNYETIKAIGDSTFVAGMNVAIATMGKGADLKVTMLSANKSGIGYTYGGYRCDTYNLGTAKTWTGEPSAMVEDYTHQYSISAEAISLAYDPNGGLWYTQYRSAPNEEQPAIKHVNAAGVEDYSDITTLARGSGISYNKDMSLLAMATANKQVTVYTVDYSTTPITLTKKYQFATRDGNNINAIAWDYADNMYMVSNSSETFGMYATPRDNNAVATPAADTYSFTLPAVVPPTPAEPAKPYLVQNWQSTTLPASVADARQGVFANGKYYIQNKADKVVEVWKENAAGTGMEKTTESYASGAGTNICKDAAGNIIVRIGSFPNAFTDTVAELRIISADGATVKDVTLSGMPAGRCDFFGDAQGNLLSAEGGKLYLTTGDATAKTNVYVVSIVNGAFDADNSFNAAPAPVALGGQTSTTVSSFTAVDGTEHVVAAVRGAGNTFLDCTWNGEALESKTLITPNKHAQNGCTMFTLAGKDYIIYGNSTAKKYLDGFSIAPFSTDEANAEVARHEETVATPTNSYQCDWFGVKVVNDSTAEIYQYYPGGFFAKYTFAVPEPEPTVSSLTQVWQSTTLPASVGDVRQGVFANGKYYIQNKADKVVEVWKENAAGTGMEKTTESYASGAGTNICKDAAGNIIVRIGTFPNAFATDTVAELRIISADGATVKDVTLSNMPAGRCDFFGDAQGNLLSAEGGKLYFTTGDATAKTNVYVVSIVNGAFDADNSFNAAPAPVALGGQTSTTVSSFTAADGTEHVVAAVRGAGNTFLDCTWNGEALESKTLITPNKHAQNGCTMFTMGGKDYIIYGNSTAKKYLDGFSIAPFSTDEANAEVARHEETVAAPTNSYQCDWFGVKVINDTKAEIYQYYPGGFFAKYIFRAPKPAAPTDMYILGMLEENGGAWNPGTGVKMTNEGNGKYTAEVNAHLASPTIGLTTTLAATTAGTPEDWNIVNAHRYGPETDLTALVSGTAAPMVQTTNAAWVLPQMGKYTIAVDAVAKTITATCTEPYVVYPEKIYCIGNIEGSAWDPSNGTVTLAKTANEGEYTGTFKVVESEAGSKVAYIGFSGSLGTSSTDWTGFNAQRYGSTTQNDELTVASEKPFGLNGDKTYTVVAPSTISVKANVKNNTIILTALTGIGEMSNNAVRVIGGVGTIKVVGDAKAIKVYNAGGAMISENEANINCASGVYVVNVDGKISKVIVR